MLGKSARRWAMGALAFGALLGACSDLLHGTDWNTCADQPSGCAGSPGQGAQGAASGGASGSTGGTGGEAPVGGGGSGGQGGQALSVTEACTKSAIWSCDVLAACAEPVFDNLFGSEEALCVAGHITSCEATGFAPGALFATEDLSACIDALAQFGTGSCADWFRLSSAQVIPDSCREPGTLQIGAGCVSLHQCAGNNCQLPSPTACGTCAPTSPQGGACVSVLDCDPNLICVAGLCAPPKDLAAPCMTSAECYADLVCEAGSCAPRKLLGQPCTTALGDCMPYLWCNGTTQICEAWATAPLGGECGSLPSGVLARCEEFTTCQLPDPTILIGTCVGIAEIGEPCTFDGGWFGPPCRFPARCIDGTCTVKDSAVCR